MARQFWFVFAEELNPLEEWDNPGQNTIAATRNTPRYGVFFRKDRAEQFARKLSSMHPGIEVQIAEAKQGFHSPLPTKITQKVWNEQGEYILP